MSDSPKETERQIISGCDLGKISDYTAFAVFERTRPIVKNPGVVVVDEGGSKTTSLSAIKPLSVFGNQKRDWKYNLIRMDRWELGTDYYKIASWLAKAYSKPVEQGGLGGTILAVDKTGVGNAVLEIVVNEMKKEATSLHRASIRPISITGGNTVNPDGAGWKVPKKELVSVLQALMGTGRLSIEKRIPSCATLLKEFENFKYEIRKDKAGDDAADVWREAEHDDMVLACALALWVGERGTKQFWIA